tara:strand:- start:2593 stop:2877 length:285 start_codon:yes stop_codon:yes gene_type:complete
MATAAAFMAAFSLPTLAQQSACAPHDSLLDFGKRKFGETPAVRAVDRNGNMVEFLVNPDEGSWTAVVTNPRGLACAVTSGVGWSFLKQVSGKKT